MRTSALSLLVAVSALACGPSTGGGGDGTDSPHLRLDPGDVTRTIATGQSIEVAFTVIFVDGDGDERDVTDEATFNIGLPLGTFNRGTLTTTPDRGGHTEVTATWQSYSATSDLTLLLQHVVIEPGTPSDAPDRFGGAQPGGTDPELVYPSTGVITPPNMSTMEFHFRKGGSNDLFEITFTGGAIQLVVYTTCTVLADGCVWEPSQETWDTLATAGRGDVAINYQVRGLSGDRFGLSELRSIQFASEDLLGGLYYWDAGAGAIMRYDFGRRGQTAERFLGVGDTGALQCVGCHALSRDGSRIAVGLDIPGPAVVETYSVATKMRQWGTGSGSFGFPSPNGANFMSFSPDNSKIAMSNGKNISVRSASDGTGMSMVVADGTMPDWSADGTRVAFVRDAVAAPIAGSPGVSTGNIYVTDATSWAGEISVASGNNNYYPAFSPDSAWVAFNKSWGTDSFGAVDARVYLVSASGGDSIPLEQASPTGGDSWPKWAPFVHHYAAGEVFWLTFSSPRAYGLRSSGTPQVWMVGIDPARAAAGQDPSFAAFWLPFQTFGTGNHIAQWVERVDRQECGEQPCPGGEFCENGYCVPDVE